MIIVSLKGGLGNQLFQYAAARRLAALHGTELLLDTSGFGPEGEWRPPEFAAFRRPFKLAGFRIRARVASPAEIARLRDDFYRATTRDRVVRQIRRIWPRFLWRNSHHVEREYRFQREVLSLPDDVYLDGFWQSPKYFDDIAPLIREECQVADAAITASAQLAVAQLREKHGEVVSLHVRRGDLAHAHEVLGKKGITHGAPVTIAYITLAMSRFAPDTCFFVFSDSAKDIEWCKQNIHATNIHFSEASSDLWDFTAMTACDHHIIANSTFSWWSAWLDHKGGRVIAPSTWSPPETRFKMVIADLLPDRWDVL